MEKTALDELLRSIQEKLDQKNYKDLKNTLTDLFPVDIAEFLEALSQEECVVLFRLLPKDQAAEVFSYLGAGRRKYIVSGIHESLLTHIFDELYFDDKIDFLEEMPANVVKSLLTHSLPETRNLINQFLKYPDNSAGGLMTIEYVDLKKTMTVRQALDRIKQTGVDKETIYTCYVLDDTRHLEGVVSLRSLVLSPEDAIIADIMNDNIVSAQTTDDQEDIADKFRRYDLIAIPVVDREQRLIGIITIDDILDVIEQENTEDFQLMAAMSPSDDKYMDTGVFTMARRRIVWLLLLMISATFTATIITHFEDLVTASVIMAASIPLLMNSGGNAGAQSSTMVIRSIALGEIELRDYFAVVWKEMRVGFVAGLILASVNGLRMVVTGVENSAIIFTVSITLLLAIVAAKLIGGILPIAAKALKLDPAIMAGPLIATVLDAFTLIIFFGVASVLVAI